MNLLPILFLISLLFTAQGRPIRKRASISDGIDAVGALKAFGSGSIGVMTQAMHTASNMLDKVDVQKAAKVETTPKDTVTPKGKPIVMGFDSAADSTSGSSSESSSGVSSSTKSVSNVPRAAGINADKNT